MRTIELHAGENARYRILHQTLLFSPMELKREELLSHGRLLEALQGIGVQVTRSASTDADAETQVGYDLAPEGGCIVMDEAQYGLLRRHVNGMAGKFLKKLSLEVAATLDWLDGLKEQTVAEITKGTAAS